MTKLLSRLCLFACVLATAATVACSGMTGLGGLPGAGGLAEGEGDSSTSNESGAKKPDSNTGSNPDNFSPPGSGPNPLTSAPGGTVTEAPATTLASTDPFGGYRPGSEGQVQVSRSYLMVSVIGPAGKNNCSATDNGISVFPSGRAGATIYAWLSHESTVPSESPGYFFYTGEDGQVRVNCNVFDELGQETSYEYVMLLATYIDSAGTVHRSDTVTMACPAKEPFKIEPVCLDLKIPLPQMQYQGTIPIHSNHILDYGAE